MGYRINILFTLLWFTGFSLVVKGQSKINVKSIKLDSDTLINSAIKELSLSDSVQLLEYSKIKYPDFPAIDEGLLYIDYRHNNEIKERMKNYFDELNTKIDIAYPIPTDKNLKRNINQKQLYNLTGIYLRLESLKGVDIFFYNDIQYRHMISDSPLYWFTMEGWVNYDIVDLKKEGDNNSFTVNNGTIFEIKHTNNEIQIWKETRINAQNESFSSHSRMIKLEDALSLPILTIFNTGELDDYYQGFDTIDLEAIYNK